MRARNLVCALLAVIFVAPQAIAEQWRGSYSYPDNRSPVPFTLELSGSQGAINGTISEPNTFGSPSASQLYATVRGAINGSSISFTKTYDGTGGVGHSVQYRGNGHW